MAATVVEKKKASQSARRFEVYERQAQELEAYRLLSVPKRRRWMAMTFRDLYDSGKGYFKRVVRTRTNVGDRKR
jgi:hypothetical protein